MEPRPLGKPSEIAKCGDDLRRLGRAADDLAGQATASARNPGFAGIGAATYAISGALLAVQLRAQAHTLQSLGGDVKTAASTLRDRQEEWDRRALAERERQRHERERAEREARERGAGR